MGTRKGIVTRMVNHGSGRVRLEFRVPSRGLIGFRSQFLTDTKGTGIMNHLFAGWEPLARPDSVAPGRRAGRRPRGRRDGLRDLEPAGAGRDLHRARHEVYEGMIIGENSRSQRHGRQRDEGKEADEHARLDGRRGDSPDSAAQSQPGAGHRVHQRRRAGGSDAEDDPRCESECWPRTCGPDASSGGRGGPRDYSLRRETTGSIRAARRAGVRHATSATPPAAAGSP